MQRKWKRQWRRLTQRILPSVAAGMLLLSAYSTALANPSGGTVVSGSAVISGNDALLNVTQTSNKAIINWLGFSIGKGETVNFIQPGSSAVALNRVIGNQVSNIYGRLNANGTVFLINPNGVLFAPGSQVNVGGLTASTLQLADPDFLQGNYRFRSERSGSVINQGTIRATNQAVLLGTRVKNEGVIAANITALAAGDTISLDFTGDKMLSLTVDKGAAGGNVDNSGQLQANGGIVVMTAGTKDRLLNTVVNNSGVIRAQSVHAVNGTIRLEGNTASNSGTLDASGKGVAETGGSVSVIGDAINLNQKSVVDVSGDAGGGSVKIGGAYQGGGAEQRATDVSIASGATIDAAALRRGNGGQVVVWSDDATRFGATITARGGSLGGNGGLVEVSGKKTLEYRGRVDTTAQNGKTGQLLLDPGDWTVGGGVSGTNYWNNADLAAQLATTNMTLQTDGSGSGDISVIAPLSWNSANTLTFAANRNITLSAAITAQNGGLTVGASGNINALAPISVRNFTLTGGAWNQNTMILPAFSARDFRIAGGSFLRAAGGSGINTDPYLLEDVYGLQGIGSSGMGANYYKINGKMDASVTQYWNDGAGFAPIGSFSGGITARSEFCVIDGLTIKRPTQNRVGLFANFSGSADGVRLSDVSIVGNTEVGGFAGFAKSGSVTNSFSSGAVSGNSKVGGLIGSTQSMTISNSYSDSRVGTTGVTSSAGGLIGYDWWDTIDNCYSSGSVNGTSELGGFWGNATNAVATNCYSTASVTGTGNLGGFAGYLNWGATINTSYSAGKVSGTGGNVGGFIGAINGSTYSRNCFWDMASSGQSSSNGGSGVSGLSGVNALKQGSYAAADPKDTHQWDFSGTWYMLEGNAHPFLRNEYSTKIGNSHQLQLMALNPAATYYLTNNINMTDAAMWGSGGFLPVGTTAAPFGGSFNGNTYAVNGLTINRPTMDYVGLFGYSNGQLNGVGLYNTSISGHDHVGAIAGFMGTSGTIDGSYNSGNGVSGGNFVGGLVGENGGAISNSYSVIASGHALSGSNYVGGLVGNNAATGTVNASFSSAALSSAALSSGGASVGGVVGAASAGSVTKSFWNSELFAADNHFGSGVTTAQLKTAATFSGWDLATTANAHKTWRMYDGYSFPLLSSFLTQLTVNGGDKTYDKTTAGTGDLSYSLGHVDTSKIDYSHMTVTGSGVGAVNAGVYGYTVGGLSSGQQGYDIAYGAGTLLINKAQLNVAVNNAAKTYDGLIYSGGNGVTYSGFVGGDDAAVLGGSMTYYGSSQGAKNAGNYTLNVLGLSSDNYSFNYQAGTLSVAKVGLTVTANDANKTYDGLAFSGGNGVKSYSGFVNGEDASALIGTLSYSGSSQGAKNAGTYQLKIGGLGATNYSFTYVPGTLTVAKAPLTVQAANVLKTYDATAYSGGGGVTYSGFIGSENSTALTGTLSYGGSAQGAKNAGGYTIMPSGFSATNYDVSYVPGMLQINPASVTISAVPDAKTYDGTLNSSATPLMGLLQGADSWSSVGQRFADKNAGSGKTLTPFAQINDGNGGNNYTVTYATNNGGTIGKANLNLKANNFSKSYDGTTNVTGGSATATGGTQLFGTDSVTGGTFAYADKNAGSNKRLTVSAVTVNDGNGGNNYNVSYVDNTTSSIAKAELKLTANDAGKTYDGTTNVTGGSATATGGTQLFGTDSIAGGSFAYADKNAGTNKRLTVSAVTVNDGNGGNNYNVSYVDNTTSSIAKAELKLKALDVSKTYDGTTSVTGGSATLTGGTQLFGTDSVTGGSFAYADKNAGSNKRLTISAVTVNDGNGGNNYNVSYVDNTTSSIAKAELKLTANDAVKTYDGTTNVTGGSATATGGTQLFGTDSVTGGNFAYADKNAGTNKRLTVNAVAVNDGNGGNNYNVSYVDNVTSSISQAVITVSATAISKVYDGTVTADATPTITAGGLQSGDHWTSLTETYADKNAGSGKRLLAHGVIEDSNGGNNYQIHYQDNLSGEIRQANLVVRANDEKRYVGQNNPSFTARYEGFVGAETAAELTGALQFSTAAGSGSPFGEYAISLRGTLASPNYRIQYAPGVLTVRQLTSPAYAAAVAYAGRSGLRYAPLNGKDASERRYLRLWDSADGGGIAENGMVPLTVVGINAGNRDYSYRSEQQEKTGKDEGR